MHARRAAHRAHRNGLVERHQASVVLDRKGQQVHVGDLLVAANPRPVDRAVVAQREVIGPERVVQFRAGALQLAAYTVQAEGADPSVGRKVQDADHAVLDQRTGRDLQARFGKQGIRARRMHVRIVEQGHPDVDVEQQAPHQMPSAAIRSRTCSIVTTSSRRGASA